MHKGGTCDVDNIVGGYQFKYGLPLILIIQIIYHHALADAEACAAIALYIL